MFIASAIPSRTTALIKSRLGCLYREAVTKPSPGLPRFAATLGDGSNETNPNGVVSVSLLKKSWRYGPTLPADHDVRFARDATPLGLCHFSTTRPQGSRAARQPWAELRNPFAVGRI